MSLVDVDSWITEYEACERLSKALHAQITQREKRQQSPTENRRLTAAINVGLKQFDTELNQLRSRLSAATRSSSISFMETEQRQQQLDNLQTQLLQLQIRTGAPAREALLNDGATTSRSADDIIDTTNVNILKQRQVDIIEQQNRGLEVLSQTISRQRSLATQLGQEVEDQNEILDNLGNALNRVETGVQAETGNIGLVTRKDVTWGYWIVIILLFIAIIVVASI